MKCFYTTFVLISEKNKLENEKEDLSHRLLENDSEIQKVKKELQENREKLRQANEVS